VALFNDGSLSTIADLMNYETSILDTAGTEGIDTSTKLRLAQEEIGEKLLTFLMETEYNGWALRSRERRHLKTGLSDVVVTRQLRRWHTFRTLAMVYRDAYNNQLNDRYQGKWQNYERLQGEAEQSYLRSGVGLVLNPAPKPAPPTLSTTNGPTIAGTYCFAYSWIAMDGTEGACSDATTIALAANTQAIVSCGAAPHDISGWNVYAGTTADALSMQNGNPLALTDHWAQSSPLVTGNPPRNGQAPNYWVVDDHRLRRG